MVSKYKSGKESSMDYFQYVMEHFTIVRNGWIQDVFSKEDEKSLCIGFARSTLGDHVFVKKQTWILSRLCGIFEQSENEIIVDYLKDNTRHYIPNIVETNENIEMEELILALIYSAKQHEVLDELYSIYAELYPKTAQNVDAMYKAYDDRRPTSEQISKMSNLMFTQIDNDLPMDVAIFMAAEKGLDKEYIPPIFRLCYGEEADVVKEHATDNTRYVFSRLLARRTSLDDGKMPDIDNFAANHTKSEQIVQSQLNQKDLWDNWIAKKYLKKREELLFQQIGCEREKFADFILQDGLLEYRHFYPIWITMLQQYKIQNDICYDRNIEYKKHITDHTKQDLYILLDDFYKSKLVTYLSEISKKELDNLTVRDITTVIGADEIDKDVNAFLGYATASIALSVANYFKQQYYSIYDFSGTYVADSNPLARSYQKMIAELNSTIKEQQGVIERYEKQEQSREFRKSLPSEKPLLKEISNLKRRNEEKDEEIRELNDKLNAAMEYYELLEEGEKNASQHKTETADLSLLHGKKILFVCHDISLNFPKLRKEFPGCAFLESSNGKLQWKNIDLIVYVTSKISHSLYFKVKGQYDKTPSLAFNKRNIDELKTELALYFAKEMD